jgi:hypothetical protein
MEEASVGVGRGAGDGSSPDALLEPKYTIGRGSKEWESQQSEPLRSAESASS